MPDDGAVSIGVHEAVPEAARDLIAAGLDAFNDAAAPLHEVRSLACLAEDADGALVGGAIGRTWGECVELQQLWVDAAQRRRGIGRQLVRGFENEARRRGCRTAYLETFSFQAPAFYRSLGYRAGQALAGFAPGVEKYLMRRRLDASPAHPVHLATGDVRAACERVLRSLPSWFGKEASLLEYVADTAALPTFVVEHDGAIVGFASVREHFAQACEIHCIAVDAANRGTGLGRALVERIEDWAAARGIRLLQVKTVGAGSTSAAYALTRGFYERLGFIALETLPIWDARNPCLQLVKALPGAG